MKSIRNSILLTLSWVALLAIFFAQVEIQIEGSAGWAVNLPTWRIEQHWLLDLFWGGRAMTGYHAWVFPLIAMFFHFPMFMLQQWSLALQARTIACIIVFWIIEDASWFIMNPAFGWHALRPENVPWHHHWWWGLPVDYWLGSAVAFVLFYLSYRRK
ncbi:hypothetical protein [Undibacterium crateris]|uniref:hypothetical protein n=1 Tax=Undibacterium crateris TaxID=2528175 RepID=UPI00138A0F80|nr:hypothetical protein [Undibacterium crateris]NDI87181.1 hypothetical protein [Undibacterium crateris]